MIIYLNFKVRDYKSYFSDAIEEDKISEIKITMKNVIFIQVDGMRLFIQRLSTFVNLNTFTLDLQNQKICDDFFEQLYLSLQEMEKLKKFTLNSTNTKISQNQINSLFSILEDHSSIQFVEIQIKQYQFENEQQQHLSIFKYFESAENLQAINFSMEDGQKKYSGNYSQVQGAKRLRIEAKFFEISENEFKHINQFILNRNGIKAFTLIFNRANLSLNNLEYIFKSIVSVSTPEEIRLEINQNNLVLEDYLLQIKYLQQSKQLKSLKYKIQDYDILGNLEYHSDLNQIEISLHSVSINESNAESFSQFIKSFEELQKIKMNFRLFEIQPKQLGIFLSFLRDHSSIKDLSFLFSNNKLNSEQLLALTQELKQSKSLENLDIILDRPQLDEQGNYILSQQLSQLENIKNLKYEPLFNKTDISTTFINEISKNQSLQELQITLCHLENHQNYQESMKKLLSMHSLKTLTLYFYISLSYEVEFFKNLAEIQQTNLQHLIIILDSERCKEDQIQLFGNLGKQLSKTVIRNITIKVYHNRDFIRTSVELFKNLNQAQFQTLNFQFNDSYIFECRNSLNKLMLDCKKKHQRLVNLKFN